MSEGECYLCGHVVTPHGIHGLDEIGLCDDCRNKFVYLRYLADPLSGSVLGFECKQCGFTCDVPGVIESEMVDGEMVHTVRVDKQHKYCQSCGASARTTVEQQNDQT